jgi:hypothetical protein
MALIKKTLFPENLDKYTTFINDTDINSKYFKITELPDTFTGGKNAFLIAGSSELVADTVVKVEIKDAAGNIIYYEPGEGRMYSEINGEQFISEYYEGVSKVVAVYIYPDTTSYGPCTITILGELSSYYDSDGLLSTIPLDWQGTYNVKWQKTVNVNPTLPNTTKIRFYKRPTVTINEILSPIYQIDSEAGLKINTGINQSFADIRISNLETFAGDVKRVKVFRTSTGDISDYDMIQDILVESKELLITYDLSSSVIGNTGTFTSETLKQYWNTGSLQATLTTDKVESGLKLNGSGNLRYSSSLQLKSTNTYEINLDAFYSSSTDSNIGIYLSGSDGGDVLVGSLNGISPTKNLLDTTIPFKLDSDFASASLYFSQSNGEWHLGNISLKLSEDTAFSPDAISFITSMPNVVSNQDFNFKFEFYDVNSNYVPVLVTGSASFVGGSTAITKLLTFESDRTAFRFSTGSYANPPSQFVKFKTTRTNFTGSVVYSSASFDTNGNYIEPSSYAGAYPGAFQIQNDNEALLSVANFTGSINTVLVGTITFTASCEGFEEYETIYRFEDGDNAPGIFVTSNANQFIYKATDLSLNPAGQIITIEAKRKNLASATTPLTVNSGSGKPPLTFVSTNATNGVDTYTLAGTTYPYGTGETRYFISGSDQFGNEFSDAIKITPVKILDGLSATLTNDNVSLPALSTGVVVSDSFLFTSGSVNVKVGNETIAFDDDNDGNRANNTFAITNITGLGCTPNSSNPSDNSYSITALSSDSGSLDITIDYKDGTGDSTSLIKTATYTKNKKASPVLEFVIGNNNQTVTAKSTGEQIDSFANATFAVNETYNGATTQKTFTPTSITATNSYSVGNANATSLILPSMANGTDSVDISVIGSVVDSENTTRLVYGSISLAKVKKASPVLEFVIGNNNQTVTATPIGGQINSFVNATFAVNETYNGATTPKTFTPTSITATNSYIVGNATATSLILPNIADATDSVDISVTGSVVDSENTTRNVYGSISLVKVRGIATASVYFASPETQTVLGEYGPEYPENPIIYQLQTATLQDVVVNTLDGDNSNFIELIFTSQKGLTATPAISGSTVFMSGTRIGASAAAVRVTVRYYDTDGTTIRTQLIIIKASTTLSADLQDIGGFTAYDAALSSATASFSSSIGSLNTVTASLYRATASLNLATASLYLSTASLNLATASLYLSTASLNSATASLYLSTASLNQYTQSQDSKNLTLSSVTASLNQYTQSQDSKNLTLSSVTASLYLSTASLNSATASLYRATASLNLTTESLYRATASLNLTTESLYRATASLNSATASFSSSIGSLNTVTASLYRATASLNLTTESLYRATASLNSATASFSSSIGSLSSSIGSLNSATESLYRATASLNLTTESLYRATASLNLTTESLYRATASLNSATASFSSSIGSLSSKTGSYATTGSNIFYGNQDVRGQVSADLGTLTNPAYSFVGDLNTGLYSPSADALALVTNAANRIHVDNVGNVGIETATPSSTSKLHVNNAVGKSVRFQNTYFSNSIESGTNFARGGIFNNAEYIEEAGAKVWKIRAIGANDAAGILFGNSGTLNFISVPNVENADRSLTHDQLLSNARLTILSTGLVGIGTTTPATILDVRGQVSANLGSLANPAYSFVGDLNTGLYSPSADALALVTNGVNRLNISSGGDVNIGGGAGTNSLIVNKSITGGGDASGIRSSGQIQSDVTGSAFMFRAVVNQANFALPTLIVYESQTGTVSGTGTLFVNFRALANPTGFTNVYGFQSLIDSGTNRYGIYNSGTAQNHFRGNVGIGVDSTIPLTALDVRGQVSANLGTATAPAYSFVGDLNTGVYSPSADAVSIATNGVESLRVNNVGNILIGGTSTTSVSTLNRGVYLQSQTDNDIIGYSLYSNEGSNNRRALFYLDDNLGEFGLRSTAASGVPTFAIRVGNNLSVYSATNGNVGIGTDNPTSKLEVVTGATGAYFTRLSGNVGVTAPAIGLLTALTTTRINSYGDALQIFTGEVGATTTQKMAILASGEVGIGVANPSRELTLKESYVLGWRYTTSNSGSFHRITGGGANPINFKVDYTGVVSTPVFTFDGNATNILTMLNGGNVGIGAINPTAKLEINQDANATGLLVTGGSSGLDMARFVRDIGGDVTVGINGSGGDAQMYFTTTGNTFAIGTDGSSFKISDSAAVGTNDRLTIDSTGNVGIGTTTPSQSLHVFTATPYQIQVQRSGVGSALIGVSAQTQNSTGDLLFDAVTGSQGFVFRSRDASNTVLNSLGIDRNGNVGIGIFSPATKLDVRGQVSANAGTATAPAYSFVGDLNTGLYSPSADTLALATNGVNRVNISDGGVMSVASSATFVGDVTANTSDKRLKDNIRVIDNPLEKLSKINGVYFNWNDTAKDLIHKSDDIEEVGFLAQEVQSVLPHIVKPAPFDIDVLTGESKSGENYLTIQYEKIVPLLVEAIKELKKQVDELKNK